MDRREFLMTTSVGLTAMSISHGAYAAASTKTPRVGIIGPGWYGKVDLFRLLQIAPVEVVGVCDVDQRMAAGAAEMVAERQASKKKPPTWQDYRKMLNEEQFDIVLIDTPDHWHALQMIDCVNKGMTSGPDLLQSGPTRN